MGLSGIKGLAFLPGSNDLVMATSSMENELLLISLSKRAILLCVPLGKKQRAESFCFVPDADESLQVLVACGNGQLIRVTFSCDLSTCASEEAFEAATAAATVATVATSELRLTSVSATSREVAFIAGAVHGERMQCAVHRVDLVSGAIAAEPVIRAPMIRALTHDAACGCLLAGVVELTGEGTTFKSEVCGGI